MSFPWNIIMFTATNLVINHWPNDLQRPMIAGRLLWPKTDLQRYALTWLTCDVMFPQQLPVFLIDLLGIVRRQVVDLQTDSFHRLFSRLCDLRLTLLLQVLQTLLPLANDANGQGGVQTLLWEGRGFESCECSTAIWRRRSQYRVRVCLCVCARVRANCKCR